MDELGSVARVAEHAGFAYVAVCDHVAIPKPGAPAMSTTWFDCVATLSYLAALTHRVRLLSHVYVLPYRHPLLVAKQWTTLDALSGGRAILGVGAGHVEGEFDALGRRLPPPGRLLDEAIDAVRAALTDEFSSHEGDVWSYDEVGLTPRPVQRRVPIWVGGSSPAALRRAAERGDGWLPQGPPEGGCRPASPGCARCGRRRAGRTSPSPSAPSPARCTWATPLGHRPGGPRLARAGRRVPAGAGRVGGRPDPGHASAAGTCTSSTTSSGCSGPRWPRWGALTGQTRLRPPSTASTWPVM